MIFSLLLLLLFAIIPIAVVVMIIVAIIKRGKSADGSSSIKLFEKSIRSIYVYIVLICLLCTIIGGIIYLFNSGLDLLIPKKKNPEYYDYSYDYDYNYKTESNLNNELRERNEKLVGVFTSSSMLISCVPLFVYYNKLAKRED